MTQLFDFGLGKNALVVLIGASGAGKSTLARTWPASQVLSLDALRGAVSDDPGCQEATADAVDVLHLLLERRMARKATTVIDATNVTRDARAPLVAAAKRHGMRTVAVMVSTPADVCVERQGRRPANRSVPEDTVRSQHKAMVHSHPALLSEGFNEVLFADSLYRLEPFLRSLFEAREADLGRDGSDGLGDLLLVRRYFGSEILPLWRWKPGSDLVTGRDRVGQVRLGQQYLTLAYRDDVDGAGDFGFDVLLPCPFEDECAGLAWAGDSVTDLYRALTGEMDNDPDIVCTVHADPVDDDQDDDPEGRADLAQALEAVHG
ncbi:AAA family ATPase [Streptomyces sp. ISL-98]|uniref:ATP-binding protein n=1 Tax=Streptomyces sp. ISL-98 TaxID=2819192 RepID=UPI001BE9942B|nr:ATP-binding protein [Streptomyces sp. ISL-98]MBT2511480.1 AAA family ATPase [Streptomyces sp. ISL-98]